MLSRTTLLVKAIGFELGMDEKVLVVDGHVSKLGVEGRSEGAF